MEKIVRIDDTGSTFDYLEEIVRCKDCVHWEKNNWNPNGMCNAFDDGSVCILTETDADEYCARAERKEQ